MRDLGIMRLSQNKREAELLDARLERLGEGRLDDKIFALLHARKNDPARMQAQSQRSLCLPRRQLERMHQLRVRRTRARRGIAEIAGNRRVQDMR